MVSVHQRYRQTDRQTDGGLTTAIPRFALRASRRKNQIVIFGSFRDIVKNSE